jgi:hypothetical protein
LTEMLPPTSPVLATLPITSRVFIDLLSVIACSSYFAKN